MFRIAHRGASGTEPENTLRAIQRALDSGARAIEIDLRLAEKELLVFHDSRLERTTNGGGYFARKSLAYLRALDAGHGERIPTLGEVCRLVAGRALLNLELKGRGTGLPTATFLQALVAAGEGKHEDFLVSSFLRGEMREFRRHDAARTPIGLLLARPTRLFTLSARRYGAVTVHAPLKYTNRALVERAHRSGLKVYVYTVNDAAEEARLASIGVDGVFTDFP